MHRQRRTKVLDFLGVFFGKIPWQNLGFEPLPCPTSHASWEYWMRSQYVLSTCLSNDENFFSPFQPRVNMLDQHPKQRHILKPLSKMTVIIFKKSQVTNIQMKWNQAIKKQSQPTTCMRQAMISRSIKQQMEVTILTAITIYGVFYFQLL